jgi:hypothetical protein
VTNPSEARAPYVIALVDQIQAALRDKDGIRFAQTVRTLYLRDPGVARTILREALRGPARAGSDRDDLTVPEE